MPFLHTMIKSQHGCFGNKPHSNWKFEVMKYCVSDGHIFLASVWSFHLTPFTLYKGKKISGRELKLQEEGEEETYSTCFWTSPCFCNKASLQTSSNCGTNGHIVELCGPGERQDKCFNYIPVCYIHFHLFCIEVLRSGKVLLDKTKVACKWCFAYICLWWRLKEHV